MNDTPKLVSHEQLQKAGVQIVQKVAPHRAVQMILELAMHPFEDVMYEKLNEANELQAMSYR